MEIGEEAGAEPFHGVSPRFGGSLDGLWAPIDLVEEGGAEPGVLKVVLLCRLVQLVLREPVKLGSVHSSQFGPGVPKHVGG
jgi:hypothetical protein